MKAVRLPYLLVALLIAALMAAILLAMGQPAICKCGEIALWAPGASGPTTSQMLADWYAPSHIIHGFLFYGALWLVARSMPVEKRFLWAVALEAAWEIFENSPPVLDRFRAVTIEAGYYGDAVINSLSDVLMMALGFYAARKLPLWVSVVIVVTLEVAAALAIRNGLIFTVWMLAFPNDTIRDWQAGGGLF